MRGSDIIVEMLIAYGVEHVFGVSGDTSVRLYESFYRYQRPDHPCALPRRTLGLLRRRCVRPADLQARRVREPIRSGRALHGAGCGRGQRLLRARDCLDLGHRPGSEGKGTITELDHHVLYESITKWSHFIKRYDKIPDTMRRAFRVATTGRPGAVHIAFPQEVLNAEVPGGERGIYAEAACTALPLVSRSGPSRPSSSGRSIC